MTTERKHQTICMQCAMKAFVEGRDYEPENEHPLEHMARVHPDPVATKAEFDHLMPLAEAKVAESIAAHLREIGLGVMKARGEFN